MKSVSFFSFSLELLIRYGRVKRAEICLEWLSQCQFNFCEKNALCLSVIAMQSERKYRYAEEQWSPWGRTNSISPLSRIVMSLQNEKKNNVVNVQVRHIENGLERLMNKGKRHVLPKIDKLLFDHHHQPHRRIGKLSKQKANDEEK